MGTRVLGSMVEWVGEGSKGMIVLKFWYLVDSGMASFLYLASSAR
jgi:hypothetical protein